MVAEDSKHLVDAAAASIDDELRAALAQIIRAIQDGTEPREAVAAAMDSFRGHMAETMAAALSSLMAAAIGSEAALAIKVGLCGTSKAKDANIRQALIDRLGPPGSKKSPGPTFGVTSHAWAALAVAVTAQGTA